MTTTYLTVPQYAARHGVSVSRVHQWIVAGRLDHALRDGQIVIDAATPRPEKFRRGRPKGSTQVGNSK